MLSALLLPFFLIVDTSLYICETKRVSTFRFFLEKIMTNGCLLIKNVSFLNVEDTILRVASIFRSIASVFNCQFHITR